MREVSRQHLASSDETTSLLELDSEERSYTRVRTRIRMLESVSCACILWR